MGLRRSKFTHVLLIVRIALENLLLFRESIEKVTASQVRYPLRSPWSVILTSEGKTLVVCNLFVVAAWKARFRFEAVSTYA
jgi:hypothetical protein